ncbi:hypothetical protein Nepgr_033480 [Nepenthes gracilis]|uniref:Uncharacterized protein n=1 Tax=Nepenthes gracilis TaxID=150966 RepID=A0AAD3Y8Z7_NEPGR|nr:hypothetical protein Nepgr_033480 [Nepenthes gracilis]
MEKSRSFPQYSTSKNGRLGFQGGPRSSYSFNGPTNRTDPETKRKRRVASYNMFAVEGKLKSSLKSSFKWIKTKLHHL